jgi:hypothetical protein
LTTAGQSDQCIAIKGESTESRAAERANQSPDVVNWLGLKQSTVVSADSCHSFLGYFYLCLGFEQRAICEQSATSRQDNNSLRLFALD